MHDDAILYGQIASSWRPEEWVVRGKALSREAYGCMMRKGDPVFTQFVDDVIARLMSSGEAKKLHKKWFMSPIPPHDINLNFQMSDAMIDLYKHPNKNSLD